MLAVFTALDWLIVLMYVVGATAAGLLCRKYIHNIADFIVAGRTLGTFIGVATLAGTELGLVTVVYWAELGFSAGFSAFIVGLLAGGSMLLVGLTGFLVKGLRASGAMTLAEYYEMRYSPNVRLLGGIIIATAGILNMGVFLKAGAIFCKHIMNLPDTLNLALSNSAAGTIWQANLPMINIVMTVLLVLVLAYTLAGGMVSVVLTDYLQFLILSVGIALATWFAWTRGSFESLDNLFDIVRSNKGQAGLNPFVKEEIDGALIGFGVVWVLWQALHWIGTSTWQTYAMRTSSVDSPGTAKSMYAITGLLFFGRAIIPMFWGIAALAFFANLGELHQINSLAAMPEFLGRILPMGVVGILVAGMLAAFMSTHDSYLLAWSAVLTQDVVSPILQKVGKDLSQTARIWLTRVFIVLIGLFLLIWGLWYQLPATMWEYLSITGTIYIAGAATLLGFGLYWKRANTLGAYLALLGGAVPGLIYLIVHDKKVFPTEWAGLISYPLAVLGMVAGSLLAERRGRQPHLQPAPAIQPAEAQPPEQQQPGPDGPGVEEI